MPAFITPDFLAIGVLTYDVTPEPGNPHGRVRPGGAATFSALCAQALGLNVAVVASAAADYPVDSVLPGIEVSIVESGFTTFFQNVYSRNGERTQVLGARSSSISRSDIPTEWLNAPIVFLGPLVQELPPDAVRWFTNAIVGAGVQGWLRRWDDYGRVTEESGPDPDLANGYRLLVGSTTEFHENDPGEMAGWMGYADILGVTGGSEGSRIYTGGDPAHVPPYATEALDPTGAGDIWGASCLVRLAEGADPVEAARFANAAASLSVEREGLTGVPTRSEIEARLIRGTPNS
ncbi:MAG: PfkB family carbohydrate kinase [Dehalococcoidia bacterium]|nr:PfkB family carbohydrate kinase [Dehalococcoidia bacterium]